MKLSNLNQRLHFALFALFLMLIFFSCEKPDYNSLDEQEITSEFSSKKGKPINYDVILPDIPGDNIIVNGTGDNKQASGWVNFRDDIGVLLNDNITEIRGQAGFVLITDNTGIVAVTFGIKNKGKKEPQYSTAEIPATQTDEDNGDITVNIIGTDIWLRKHKNGTGNGGPIVNDNVASLTFGELILVKK